MNLLLVGVNHKTAPVKVRECLAPEPEKVPDMVTDALMLPGVNEALLVSTCNRVEMLVACDCLQDTEDNLCAWLTNGKGLDSRKLVKSLYLHKDQEAVRHLFRVASSLDSMVIGEPQILGQIKDAYRIASEAGTTRTVLNRLMHKTFHVAKRVRTETLIGGAAVSVSYAAVELAKKIFDELTGLNALLIGAGEMAELAAEHLLAQGVASVTVANRTLERAMELARNLGGGKAYRLDDLPLILGEVDIVITSTGSPVPVITPELAKKAVRQRKGNPLFFIDIAVPRDVDPKVGGFDGCFIFDIDDLSQVVQGNLRIRLKEAQKAEYIVDQEVVKFNHWLSSLDVVPTITDLTAKAEDIRQAELARTLKDLKGLSPEDSEALERLTRSLVKKLIHDPILFLKEQAHEKKPETKKEHTALFRRIFYLGEK